MSKPAVIRAEFTDYRPVKTRKTLILSFEIPAEEQGAAFAALGYPVMGSSIWVAIARLQEGAGAPVPEKPAEPAPVETPKRKRSIRDFAPSQQAAMMCDANIDFRLWLTGNEVAISRLTAGLADRTLKTKLGISSKRELDSDPDKAAAWDRILTSFEHRHMVRA